MNDRETVLDPKSMYYIVTRNILENYHRIISLIPFQWIPGALSLGVERQGA
jgi:hypothetical protein